MPSVGGAFPIHGAHFEGRQAMDHEETPRSKGQRSRELVAVDALILGIYAASRISCAPPPPIPFADGEVNGFAGVQEPGGAVRIVPAGSVPLLPSSRGGDDDEEDADRVPFQPSPAPITSGEASAPPLVWQEGSFAFPGHWPLPAARLLNLPVRTARLDQSDFAAIQGIGPVLAERIVQEIGRRQGRLAPEDFGAVRGLGTAKLRLLREGLGPMADVAPMEGAGGKSGRGRGRRSPRKDLHNAASPMKGGKSEAFEAEAGRIGRAHWAERAGGEHGELDDASVDSAPPASAE